MKSLHSENVLDMSERIKMYELRAGERGWPGIAHAHTYFQLWYIRSGKCIHIIGGEACVLGQGEALLVPPYAVHTVEAGSGGCCIYACDISEEMLTADPIFRQSPSQDEKSCSMDVLLQVRGKYTLTDSARPRVEHLMKKMLDLYLKRDPYSEMELKGYFLRLLTLVLRSLLVDELSSGEMDAYTENISDALAYTAAHIGERILLKDIAACAKMGISSFNHYFKKHTGKTYVEYTNMLRLDIAKKLLTETSLSAAEVGLQAGFRNIAYFNRIFKRQEGCTPGQYRAQNVDE